jgi:serine protease Do
MTLHRLLPLLSGLLLAGGTICATAEVIDPKASMAELKDREAKIRAVVAKVMPAIVCLSPKQGFGTGSGIIISKDGLIMTAGHVTQAIGEEMVVTFPDGRKAKGKSLGRNMSMDSALAKIDEPGDYPYVEIGNSNRLKLGEWVVAMGHPGGFDLDRKPPVRLGRIWDRDRVGAIFSDCMLIGGDSGGPLFDLDGRVIGIHSSINKDAEHNRHIAADTFRGDWDDLLGAKKWGKLRLTDDDPGNPLPKLGMVLDQDPREDGVPVLEVPESSPAANSGVRKGDRIVKIDGVSLPNYWALMRELTDHKPGDKVKLSLKRGEESVDAEVHTYARKRPGMEKSGERPPAPKGKPEEKEPEKEKAKEKPQEKMKPEEPKIDTPPATRPYLGAQIEDGPPGAGAKVTEAAENSPAAKAGLKPGDIVKSINGRDVKDAVALADQLSKLKPGDKISLKLNRGGQDVSVDVVLEKK